MDTTYFGSNLTALSQVQTDRRASGKAGEDAYYKRHAPVQGRGLGIASIAAAVGFALVTIGPWLNNG